MLWPQTDYLAFNWNFNYPKLILLPLFEGPKKSPFLALFCLFSLILPNNGCLLRLFSQDARTSSSALSFGASLLDTLMVCKTNAFSHHPWWCSIFSCNALHRQGNCVQHGLFSSSVCDQITATCTVDGHVNEMSDQKKQNGQKEAEHDLFVLHLALFFLHRLVLYSSFCFFFSHSVGLFMYRIDCLCQ